MFALPWIGMPMSHPESRSGWLRRCARSGPHAAISRRAASDFQRSSSVVRTATARVFGRYPDWTCIPGGRRVHVHTPAGGQGMNTGMQYAHNLAWKLALVVTGRSPESLLDTYEQGRAPIGTDVLALTHAIVQMSTLRHPLKRAVRDLVVPIASRIPHVQRRAVRCMSQVHVAYSSSALSFGEGGERAADIPVVFDDGTPTRLYAALRGLRHVLVSDTFDELNELSPYRSLFTW